MRIPKLYLIFALTLMIIFYLSIVSARNNPVLKDYKIVEVYSQPTPTEWSDYIFHQDGSVEELPANTFPPENPDHNISGTIRFAFELGGDVAKIDTGWAAISVVKGWLYRYVWNGSQWEGYGGASNLFHPNSCYLFSDAQFFTFKGGRLSIDQYIMSAEQNWPESEATRWKGLYYSCDGTLPNIVSFPMNFGNYFSGDKKFPRLYRDLRENHITYTWYNDADKKDSALWKIIFGECPGMYTIESDFIPNDSKYREIIEFQQYMENGVRHQYLYTEVKKSLFTVSEVWHRDDSSGSLSANNWEKIN